jgi:hypothetical protein
MAAAGAGQPSHFLFDIASGNAQKTGNAVALFRRTDRALGRHEIPRDHFFREGPAAGLATRAAVRLRQAVLHLLDARVLEDEQLAVGKREHAGQANAQRGHEAAGNRKIRKIHRCSRVESFTANAASEERRTRNEPPRIAPCGRASPEALTARPEIPSGLLDGRKGCHLPTAHETGCVDPVFVTWASIGNFIAMQQKNIFFH